MLGGLPPADPSNDLVVFVPSGSDTTRDRIAKCCPQSAEICLSEWVRAFRRGGFKSLKGAISMGDGREQSWGFSCR